VFNWLIAGTDAHAKNYGLVLSGTNARLAPLYDVASALVMPEWNWHKRELAMRINKQGKFKYLSITDWQKFAAAAHVDFGTIESAIAEYAPALADAVAHAARPMDLDVDERAFVDRFTAALGEHIRGSSAGSGGLVGAPPTGGSSSETGHKVSRTGCQG